MHEEPVIAAPELELADVQRWRCSWAEIEHRIGPVFRRTDVRARALAYLTGLLSPAERKNSWQLAELCGHTTPYGLQHVLGRAVWDAEALRDRLRAYVVDSLADPQAVGVLDETGFLKKGTCSAGRVANCQIGVFLGYASRHGHTLLDRELYLPKAWTQDRERCRQAGIPNHRPFATKPVLARQILKRTFAAGVTLAWDHRLTNTERDAQSEHRYRTPSLLDRPCSCTLMPPPIPSPAPFPPSALVLIGRKRPCTLVLLVCHACLSCWRWPSSLRRCWHLLPLLRVVRSPFFH